MAIINEWTPPSTLEASPGDVYRAATVNAKLGNELYLYSAPRITIARSAGPIVVPPASDVEIEWSEPLAKHGGVWWFPETSTASVQIPRDGVYLISLRLLWPATTTATLGTYRRVQVRSDGEAVGGQRLGSTGFAEHMMTTQSAMAKGRKLSIAIRHDADDPISVTPWNDPWRSPILFVQWIAPMDVEV